MNILIDIGNENVKLSFHDGKHHLGLLSSTLIKDFPSYTQSGFTNWLSLLYVDFFEKNTEEYLKKIESGYNYFDKIDGIYISSVSEELSKVILDDFNREEISSLNIPILFIDKPTDKEVYGLKCAYDDYLKLGADRWISMIAARNLIIHDPKPFCVIDLGTALTIDAVDEKGQHLGGLILPGSHIMANSLVNKTSNIDINLQLIGNKLNDFESQNNLFGKDLLGNSTEDCILNGIILSLRSSVTSALSLLKDKIGHEYMVFVTGGDSSLILPLDEKGVEVKVFSEPNLVLQGLAFLSIWHKK
ncbi:MAG: hypothetical protein CBC38_00215 [Gammaproteobacteria bacterium TMED78]|nr:MAG: hypothetical protein CBC38_00215 [Gammaproteobacteria bacterium TMED78]|tara:strand:- start:1144 stop:2049 length:906 start_codon:yes stop_codon:yes gene_type:complete